LSCHFDFRVITAITSRIVILGGLAYVGDASRQFPHDLLWQPQRLPSSKGTRHGGGYQKRRVSPPRCFSLNARCARGRGHIPTSPLALSLSSPSPSPVMSSLSGSAIGGDKVPERGEEEAQVPKTVPPASRKRGRLKGSHNKKTLEALAAPAAVAPSTSVATRAARAPGDVSVPEKRGPSHPKGSGKKTASAAATAPSSSHRRGRPPGSKNKRTSTSSFARSRAAASPPDGPS
jgi:hypothetical protein